MDRPDTKTEHIKYVSGKLTDFLQKTLKELPSNADIIDILFKSLMNVEVLSFYATLPKGISDEELYDLVDNILEFKREVYVGIRDMENSELKVETLSHEDESTLDPKNSQLGDINSIIEDAKRTIKLME